jgi:hypothetical protein
MKKNLSFILASLLLCGCNAQPAATVPPTTAPVVIDYTASAEDVAVLEKMYEGRVAYHGDLHTHTMSGGKSDGRVAIEDWAAAVNNYGIDFTAIVDHSQTLHMYNEAWDDTMFISGAENGQLVFSINTNIGTKKMHGNYLYPSVVEHEKVLNEFPLIYAYNTHTHTFQSYAAPDGTYVGISRDQMIQIVESVKRNGGFFVFDHPVDPGYCPTSGELLDYWYVDDTAIEVFYGAYGPAENYELMNEQYTLWKNLLAAGKRVWASAGSDTHANPNHNALSTIYSSEKSGAAYVDRLRVGDFAPSPMGVRMVIGDTLMGGQGSFDGQKVIFSVGDFHESVLAKYKKFRVALCNDAGQVFSQEFSADEMAYFSIDADNNSKYYWVEIYDVATDLLIGIGNPIWNAAN